MKTFKSDQSPTVRLLNSVAEKHPQYTKIKELAERGILFPRSRYRDDN
jgi:hypothetical protein